MNSPLLELVILIAEATSSSAFLDAEDKALPTAAAEYRELLEIARHEEDAPVRVAALGLIYLLEKEDAESVLRERMAQDADSNVKAFAKQYLFRLTVGQTARQSGKMTQEQFAVYKKTARQMYAERLFAT